MKIASLFLAMLAFIFCAAPEAVAKKNKGKASEEYAFEILQVDPGSITLAIGANKEQSETFKIIKSTRIVIDGNVADAHALSAGMKAQVTPSVDKTYAVSIDAHDAGRHRH